MAGRDSEDTPALRAVSEAKAALVKAEKIADGRRIRLIDLMVVAAVENKETVARIARAATYEREHVRRLLRARGVQPTQPDRVPPPPIRKATVDAD